jgi:mannose-6-phosphate isomerase-like protein (cupin superfamily)
VIFIAFIALISEGHMKNDKVLFSYTSPNKDFIYLHSVADPPEETPKEFHHDMNEICFYISGDVMLFVEGLSYPVSQGDILCIPNRELHRLKVLSHDRYERIVLHFSESYIGVMDEQGAKALLTFLRQHLRRTGFDDPGFND